jgi:hypothetical protein
MVEWCPWNPWISKISWNTWCWIYFLRCSKHENCTNASYVWSQRRGSKLVGFDCHAAAWNSLRTGCLQQGTSQGVAKQKGLIRFRPLIMIYLRIYT